MLDVHKHRETRFVGIYLLFSDEVFVSLSIGTYIFNIYCVNMNMGTFYVVTRESKHIFSSMFLYLLVLTL